MQTDLFTTWEASKFINQWLPFRSQKSWYRYLMINPSKYREQDGYKITVHTINGERRYTKLSLASFINAHRSNDEKSSKGSIK